MPRKSPFYLLLAHTTQRPPRHRLSAPGAFPSRKSKGAPPTRAGPASAPPGRAPRRRLRSRRGAMSSRRCWETTAASACSRSSAPCSSAAGDTPVSRSSRCCCSSGSGPALSDSSPLSFVCWSTTTVRGELRFVFLLVGTAWHGVARHSTLFRPLARPRARRCGPDGPFQAS